MYALPFSVTELNRSTFILGLPTNCPVATIQGFPQSMLSYAAQIQTMMRTILQNNAGLNTARVYHYNMMSNNNFMNNEWANLIITTGEMMEYYYFTGAINEQNITGMMTKIVEDSIAISVAITVTKNPLLAQYLQPHEHAAATECTKKAAVLNQAMDQFQGRQQFPQQQQQMYPQQYQQQMPRQTYALSGGNSPALSQAMGAVHRPVNAALSAPQPVKSAPLATEPPQGERRAFRRGIKPVEQPVTQDHFPGGIMEESTPTGTRSWSVNDIPAAPDIYSLENNTLDNNMEQMNYADLEADPIQRARAVAEALTDDGVVVPLSRFVQTPVEPVDGEEEPVVEEKPLVSDKHIVVLDKILTKVAGDIVTAGWQELDKTGADFTPFKSGVLFQAKATRGLFIPTCNIANINDVITSYNRNIRNIQTIAGIQGIPAWLNPENIGHHACKIMYVRFKDEINNILHNGLLLPEDMCVDSFPNDLGGMMKWLSGQQPKIATFLTDNLELVKAKLTITDDDAAVIMKMGNGELCELVTYTRANYLLAPLDLFDLDTAITDVYRDGATTQFAIDFVATASETPKLMALAQSLFARAKKLGWRNTKWIVVLSSGNEIEFEKPWVTDSPTRFKAKIR